MDIDFWHQRWAQSDIGFHQSDANPLLVKHFNALSLPKGSRILLPLCGKTLDIGWLLAEGYRVVGAELSDMAIEQLFTELGVKPYITDTGTLKHYRAEHIDMFVGDFFHLSREVLGSVDAIYDRAALVALPEAMRRQYTAHVMEVAHTAPQLLICYVYEQGLMPGPPFSITNEEVKRHYSDSYELKFLADVDVPGGMKGVCAATENVWLLK